VELTVASLKNRGKPAMHSVVSFSIRYWIRRGLHVARQSLDQIGALAASFYGSPRVLYRCLRIAKAHILPYGGSFASGLRFAVIVPLVCSDSQSQAPGPYSAAQGVSLRLGAHSTWIYLG